MADLVRKTENLFNGNLTNAILSDTTGEEVPNDNWRCTEYMTVNDNSISVSWQSTSNFFQAKVASYDDTKTFISIETVQNYTYSNTFTLPTGTKFIKLSYSVKVGSSDIVRTNVMVNEGSALPYEPYWAHSLKKFDGTTWQNASVHEF